MRWGGPSAADARDGLWMDRALRLAAEGIGRTSPNPMVGAVLVKDGRVVGEGAHLRVGGPHAATTRATPARTSASAQGGVRPKWAHGSSVT